MNQTEHKTITALLKAIKKDMDAGVTQIAVIVQEDGESKKYIYSRPFVREAKGEE